MLTVSDLAFRLSLRRIRSHGLLLALCLWLVYAVTVSTPGLKDRNGLIKGTDFLHFYTLGTLATQGRGGWLYDIPAQSALMQQIVPEAVHMTYVPLYGPQVSLFFVPFAHLPYAWALLAWLSLNTVIYALCVYAIWKQCPNLRRHAGTVFVVAAAFPGFFHLLAWGQSSGIALFCFTAAYLALRADLPVIAGLAVGTLIFKPQLAVAAAVVFLLTQQWKVVVGAVMAAATQLGIGWLHYGTPIIRNYFYALWHVRDVLPWLEPRSYQMHSLRGFWSLLLPWSEIAFVLYVASSLVVLALLVRCWSSPISLQLKFSAMLLASVLVAPHLTVYDLVILTPAFLLLADWTTENSEQRLAAAPQLLIYLCFPLFLLGPLAQITHVQLSVITMSALFWIIMNRGVMTATPLLAAASLPPLGNATLDTP